VSRYFVGIDLGTSNTVVAYAEVAGGAIAVLPITQQLGRGEVGTRPLLPSLRYHPADGELPDELPWPALRGPAVVGHYARELGAQQPGRLVASAKSWLSHAGVDRHAKILPWGADEGIARVSPVDASASYLAHVRRAWDAQFPAAPLARQDIVLTVPASFDEGARALTLEAAQRAGLPGLRLVEEPQAAFHDWLARHRATLANALQGSRLVLVVDVGGGTTDLSLIRVDHVEAGLPRLTRIGVGDHLMLGGDNMDLALAHLAERRLGDARLPAARFTQLVERCRLAKESLLAADAPNHLKVTLLGSGSRLIGAAQSVELSRSEVEALIVDGFLPQESIAERPQPRRAGIVEFGLPYPFDPAISRHLAAFLQRHEAAARAALGDAAPPPGQLALPDTLLLNGGVFHSASLTRRLADILGAWRGAPLTVLANDAPDLAVARGAVAYALARAEPARGPSIGGGSPRSYFLQLDDGKGGGQAICVLPRGTEEDCEVDLPERRFALRVGEAVRFHLLATAGDETYAAGALIAPADIDCVRLPPLAATLPASGRNKEVTVRLTATMSAVGALDMHCVSLGEPAERWRLAFQLRGEAAADDTAPLPPQVDEAITLIERIFGNHTQGIDAHEVRKLRAQLERLLGKRDSWDIAVLRALYDALWERARRRRRSAEHERVWLNLAGFCLRPGLGAALDARRIEQLWPLFEQGIQYRQEGRNWSEWWTLWRRAAGGLPEAAQLAVLEVLAGHLEQAGGAKHLLAADPVQASYDDMVRLAAALERVPTLHRIEVGKWLLMRLTRPTEKAHTWWALGRVGARESLYGSAHTVVPPEIAAGWLEALLALDWKRVEPAAFAAAQIARLTGDRARDLPPELREQVIKRLTALRAPPGWIAMVRATDRLDEADQRRSFGEALPPGLRLIG
jgi:molecular chaperone DnaK (HSP70)